MKNFCAVAMTAALVLSAGAPALAQDEKITVEGLFFFDRNGNNVYDTGDAVRKNGRGVSVRNVDTGQMVGDFRTGADGRYRVELPKGPNYEIRNSDIFDYTSTKLGYDLAESLTNADFPLRGSRVFGYSFVDANGDKVFNPGEQKLPVSDGNLSGRAWITGTSADGVAVNLQAGPTAADGTYSIEDVPSGDLTLHAPNLTYRGLTVDPDTPDIDPATLTRKLDAFRDRQMRVDQRYLVAKSDPALVGLTLVPAKAGYRSGERAKAVIEVANKGNFPEKIKFILDGHNTDVDSVGDNAVRVEGNIMSLKEPLAPGATAKVDVDFTFTWDSPDSVRALVQRGDQFDDADQKNNEMSIDVTIDPPVVGAPSTAPSESTTTPAPSSSTPAPAPAGAATNDKLASTGASPLGFLALGGLLLVAGAGAFFAARRRRS
ncbi:LPXTG cell wall anchor domain-containing protein [Lentzea nigeriaca]|uniref:LPXTG cell wall anchor domain-containing protein n=1 Tax=Lentzea nigeriaca TaxID=1128665 RepID=UPI00195D6443|nr:LPXTG cell wall anchor domain-containing protein [Lentzea nigeriaca]MBM7861483.1 LPXTG-motif cell wall-anchored protein [Lentzea nigeriaca]